MNVDVTLIDELEIRALKAEAQVAVLQLEKDTLLALQAGAVSSCDELKAQRDVATRRAQASEEKLAVDEGEFIRLYEKIAKLEEERDDLTRIFELQRKRERPWIERWRQETGKHDCLPDYGATLEWIVGKAEAAEEQWLNGPNLATS